jgi:hypothetical protein
MADWSDEAKRAWDERMKQERDGSHEDAGALAVGDRVETPDGKRWIVVGQPTTDGFDLRADDGGMMSVVPRDLLKRVRQAE